MATLAAVRDALDTRLSTISGLRVYDLWPDTFDGPGCIIRPMGGVPHTTFSGNGSYRFELVMAVTLAGGLKRAQDLLDAYLAYSGASSILAALEGDDTLGGNAQYVLTSGWRDYGMIEINSVEYLGVVLDAEVHTTY